MNKIQKKAKKYLKAKKKLDKAKCHLRVGTSKKISFELEFDEGGAGYVRQYVTICGVPDLLSSHMSLNQAYQLYCALDELFNEGFNDDLNVKDLGLHEDPQTDS